MTVGAKFRGGLSIYQLWRTSKVGNPLKFFARWVGRFALSYRLLFFSLPLLSLPSSAKIPTSPSTFSTNSVNQGHTPSTALPALLAWTEAYVHSHQPLKSYIPMSTSPFTTLAHVQTSLGRVQIARRYALVMDVSCKLGFPFPYGRPQLTRRLQIPQLGDCPSISAAKTPFAVEPVVAAIIPSPPTLISLP